MYALEIYNNLIFFWLFFSDFMIEVNIKGQLILKKFYKQRHNDSVRHIIIVSADSTLNSFLSIICC